MKQPYMQHGMPIDAQPLIQHGERAGTLHMMGNLMLPDARILHALRNSGLVENLRDFEVNILANLITIQYFEVREIVAEPGHDALNDALMILVEGEIEVSAFVGNEPVALHLAIPGDMARIISFVGGDMVHVSSRIKVKKGSAVLLLQRSRLETLLFSHPSVVYCVMRNLVRHVHGVARRKNAEKEAMSNYIYSTHGRF
ncbi:MAG: cyclic nucleotide-binding domain-containing protein [Gallionella sp.]